MKASARSVENRIAESFAKLRRIRRVLDFRDHGVRARIRHLLGRKQRQARLIVRRLRPAVPGPAAGGTLIDAVVLVVSKKCSVNGGMFCCTERGHRAQAGLGVVGAAALHGGVARGPEAVRGEWQVAQASLPEADRAVSKNSSRPSTVNAAAEGIFSKQLP